jgi:hypothetical protein
MLREIREAVAGVGDLVEVGEEAVVVEEEEEAVVAEVAAKKS